MTLLSRDCNVVISSGNGKIDKGEFTEEFVNKYGVAQDRAEKVFTKLDRDGSGQVTLDEVSALFKDMDADGKTIPDNKVHGANMGPIWGRQDPGGPHVGPMIFQAISLKHGRPC